MAAKPQLPRYPPPMYLKHRAEIHLQMRVQLAHALLMYATAGVVMPLSQQHIVKRARPSAIAHHMPDPDFGSCHWAPCASSAHEAPPQASQDPRGSASSQASLPSRGSDSSLESLRSGDLPGDWHHTPRWKGTSVFCDHTLRHLSKLSNVGFPAEALVRARTAAACILIFWCSACCSSGDGSVGTARQALALNSYT